MARGGACEVSICGYLEIRVGDYGTWNSDWSGVANDLTQEDVLIYFKKNTCQLEATATYGRGAGVPLN